MRKDIAIKTAINLYGKYNRSMEDARKYKYQICKIVEQVCEIKNGGRTPQELKDIASGKILTLKNFAIAIGMKPATLQKWSEDYRNVIKPLEEEKLIDSLKLTKEQAAIVHNLKQTGGHIINSKTPKSIVIEKYKRARKQSKEDLLLDKYILEAKTVFNFVNSHALDKFNKKCILSLKKIVKKTNDILMEVSDDSIYCRNTIVTNNSGRR